MRKKSASVSGQGLLRSTSLPFVSPRLTDLLSVSVGGVIFENEFGFEGMYRAAEQQLSNAETSGDVRIMRIAKDLSPTPDDHHSHH